MYTIFQNLTLNYSFMRSGNFKNLILLLCLFGNLNLPCFSQDKTQELYRLLDQYIEAPTPIHQTQLTRYIDLTSVNGQPLELAKVIAYCNIGYFNSRQFHYAEAIRYYEKAKQLYFKHNLKGYDIIEYGLKPLGNLYTKTQALQEAEQTIKHYIVLAGEQQHPAHEISGILNLSTLYYTQGKFAKAKKSIEAGLLIQPDHKELKLNLANVYFAQNDFNSAKQILDALLPSSNSKVYQLKAQINLHENKYEQGLVNLNKALTILKDHHPGDFRQEAKIYLAIAETHRLHHQFPEAFQAISSVYSLLIPSFSTNDLLPSHDQLYAETILMDALDLQADIWQQLGKPEKSLKTYQAAAMVNDFIFYELYSPSNKYSVQQHIKKRTEKMLNLLYHLFEVSSDDTYLEQALQLDSKTKGRIADQTARVKKTLYAKHSKEIIQLQRLQEKLQKIRTEINRYIQQNDLQSIPALQKEYSHSLTSLNLLQERIFKKEFTAHSEAHFSIKEFQKKADTLRQTIVTYFIGKTSTFQFVINAKEIQFNRLSRSKAEHEKFLQTIGQYNHLFDSPNRINSDLVAFQEISFDLFKKLHLPTAKNIVIIPDGLLSFVPFQTLLTAPSKTYQFKEMPFLIHKSTLSYSISLRNYMQSEVKLPSSPTVLGIFPRFQNSAQELSFSTAEAESLRKFFKTKSLMDEQATILNFKNNLPNHAIIHLSSHAQAGSFNEEASIAFIDGALSASELYNFHLPSNLVVLSACDTGVGSVIQGEGPLSLARSFQSAGAQSLLFSLWEVNDQSTAIWMRNFYQALKKTTSKNISTQQAGIAYLNNKHIDNSHKSPYYWGAFVYYGQTSTAQAPSPIWEILILLSLLALSLFLYLFWIQRVQNKHKHYYTERIRKEL